MITLVPVTWPEGAQAEDLPALADTAVAALGSVWQDGDVLVLPHPLPGLSRALKDHDENDRAPDVAVPPAARLGTALALGRGVVAERLGQDGVERLIRTRDGSIGTGLDDGGDAGLLPPTARPDAVARSLRAALVDRGAPRIAVLLTRPRPRPWRRGRQPVAVGCAGLATSDQTPWDDLAASASALAGDADLVLVRGTGLVTPEDGPGASALDDDRTWFRLGDHEAVRTALGVAPGTAEAVEVGLRPVGDDDLEQRITRACAVAVHAQGLPRVPARHPQAKRVATDVRCDRARTHLTQVGVRVEAPDDLTVGLVVGRLVAALAGEGVPATLASHDRTAAGPSALVVFL